MQDLETSRLILSCAAITPDEIVSAHRMYVEEMGETTLSLDAFEQEVQFDACFAWNNLGISFGRPSLRLKDTKRRIGHCVLMPRLTSAIELNAVGLVVETHSSGIEAEIGWAVSSNYRNQGYATEAGQRLLDYAFEALGLLRVLAFTEVDNVASQKVMRKIGMKLSQLNNGSEVIGLAIR